MDIKSISEVDFPEIGKIYMVPGIKTHIGGKYMFLPILGTFHEDHEIGNSEYHLHYDERFLTDKMDEFINYGGLQEIPVTGITDDDGVRLVYPEDANCYGQFPTPEEFPFLCVKQFTDRSSIRPRWYHSLFVKMKRKNKDKLDLKCKKCPHKGFPLNGVIPKDGILTCPGHLLKWDAETGELLNIK